MKPGELTLSPFYKAIGTGTLESEMKGDRFVANNISLNYIKAGRYGDRSSRINS
jgi:hypothetical protein